MKGSAALLIPAARRVHVDFRERKGATKALTSNVGKLATSSTESYGEEEGSITANQNDFFQLARWIGDAFGFPDLLTLDGAGAWGPLHRLLNSRRSLNNHHRRLLHDDDLCRLRKEWKCYRNERHKLRRTKDRHIERARIDGCKVNEIETKSRHRKGCLQV